MNLLLAVPIFAFSFFPNINFKDIADSAGAGAKMEIAADSAFGNATTKFSGGQTIYVRVTTQNGGQNKHDLNLHDNQYNLLNTYSMTRSGDQFNVSFAAPTSSGNYSLEANIVSGSSVVNLVRTIEVGNSGGNSQVSVKVNNQVNTGSQVLGNKESNSPSPTPQADTAVKETEKHEGFFAGIWSLVIGFLKNLLPNRG